MTDRLPNNLFADLPTHLSEELVDRLIENRNVRIERIISTGQCSPPDFWYDQDEAEWVVVLRIDSPRFSVHEDAPEKCSCPSCNGEMTKPILRHDHPASLVPLPKQNVPSRGWGEDFWVRMSLT